MKTTIAISWTYICMILVYPISAAGQAPLPFDQNYIRTKTYTSANENFYYDDIDYFDGLGKLRQSLNRAASPSGKDLITLTEYDGLARKACIWLPTPIAASGAFITSSAIKSSAISSAGYSDEMPYSLTVYENAPNDRVVETHAPGAAFKVAGPTTQTSYLLNNLSDSLQCLRLEITMTSTAPGLENCGIYPYGKIFITSTEDADGGVKYEFSNSRQEMILSRQKSAMGSYNDTYYLYDDSGNLRYVLPPELSVIVKQGGGLTDDHPAMDKYAYIYKYDLRNRCVQNKLPGAGWIYYGFDRTDKTILTQDALLRQQNKWLITLYDAFGRPTVSGLYPAERISQQSFCDLDATSTFDLTATDTFYYRTEAGIDLTAIEVATVNFYDDYRFRSAMPSLFGTLGYIQIAGYGMREGVDSDLVTCKGVLTGCIAATLSTPQKLLGTCYFYDNKGRLIQQNASNFQGGKHTLCMAYDFRNNIIAKRESNSSSPTAMADVIISSSTYDMRDRILSETTTLNGGATTATVYAYDEFGRHISSSHGTGANTFSTFRQYNIRGWVTSLNNNLFSMQLRYNDPVMHGSVPSFVGNISEWHWQHTDAPGQTYGFIYDPLARMTECRQFVNGVRNDLFVERGLTYDRNSNILSLQRYASGSLADNFSYAYSGNQLTTLSGTTTGSYIYDTNGNMTHDGPNNLDLTYNQLNLLEKVEQSGSTVANYSYLSDGTKLSATDADGNGLYYRGSLVYRKQGSDLKLESASFNGGRFVATASSIDTYYHITDHLGSVRAVVDSSGEVKERSDYYPYGLRWEDAGSQLSDNRYRYNGKEEQSFAGVPYSDYGARMLDKRYRLSWLGVDPLSGKRPAESVYGFCGGNPVHRIDSDGQIWDTVWDVINLVYDTGAAIYNHATGDHAAAKSHWVDAGSDLLAMAIPFVPAGATKIIKAGDKAVDAAKAVDKSTDAMKATKRGVESEKRVLNDMGLEKNTKPMSLKNQGGKKTIPDAVDTKTIYEVKDTKNVSNTKQIRLQRRIAEREGKQYKVITGDNTHVSGNIKPEEIIRRQDLGPQQ